jgi:hypothetical protein
MGAVILYLSTIRQSRSSPSYTFNSQAAILVNSGRMIVKSSISCGILILFPAGYIPRCEMAKHLCLKQVKSSHSNRPSSHQSLFTSCLFTFLFCVGSVRHHGIYAKEQDPGLYRSNDAAAKYPGVRFRFPWGHTYPCRPRFPIGPSARQPVSSCSRCRARQQLRPVQRLQGSQDIVGRQVRFPSWLGFGEMHDIVHREDTFELILFVDYH